MTLNIHYNLVQLSQITESLNRERLAGKDYQTISERVEQCLEQLEGMAFYRRTLFNGPLRNEALGVLVDLGRRLKEIDSKSSNTQSLADRVEEVCSLITNPSPAHLEGASEYVYFALLPDIGEGDKNGAIIQKMRPIIEAGKIPFITTRSILKGVDLQSAQRDHMVLALERLLEQKESKWDIYQQNSPGGEEGFLVFIPASLGADQESGKLASLDLASEVKLKKITLKEALGRPLKKVQMSQFSLLFSKRPLHPKLFYLAAHGSSDPEKEDSSMQQLISDLERQLCKGLTITSCYAGGKGSMQFLNKEERGSKLHAFHSTRKAAPFPTIVRSIGDFYSVSQQEAEENLASYFKELASLLDQPGRHSTPHVKNLISSHEKGYQPKAAENLMKVYFPHSEGIPGGFRPVDEGARGYSLTYNELRKKGLADKLNHKKCKNKDLTIRNKELLHLHPLIADIPLAFQGRNALLLSMIPGKAHHFIQSVELVEGSAMDFLEDVAIFHKNQRVGATKAFFIKELVSSDLTLREVGLQLFPGGEKKLLFRSRGSHYMLSSGQFREMTPTQFAIEVAKMVRDTRPDSDSVRVSTGGQQSEEMFQQALWEHNPALEEFMADGGPLKARIASMNSEELVCFVFFLIESGNSDKALQLVRSEGLDPNARNMEGKPLMVAACEQGSLNLVEGLVSLGADCNLCDRTGKTPLASAVASGSPDLCVYLLDRGEVKVDHKNFMGWTPLALALRQEGKILELLLNNGASVNYTSSGGDTPLSAAVVLNNPQALHQLLDAGADPNAGEVSALFRAVLANNIECARILMKNGADPFKMDGRGRVPAVEAIKRCGQEMVRLLLEVDDRNLSVADKSGINPMVAAVFTGDVELVRLVVSMGGRLPERLSEEARLILRFSLERMRHFNDYSMLEVFEHGNAFSTEFEKDTADHLIRDNPEQLQTLIENNTINPDSSESPEGETVFTSLCKEACNNFNRLRKLLKACVERGADVNRGTVAGTAPLEMAMYSKDRDFILFLLKAGAQVPDDVKTELLSFDDPEILRVIQLKSRPQRAQQKSAGRRIP